MRMHNTKTLNAFLSLLKAGIWDKKPVQNDYFPLTEQEWSIVFDMAKKQTVEALVYDGIQQLDVTNHPSRDLLLKWVVLVNAIEKRNIKVNQCIDEQGVYFRELGVSTILLKGQGIAQFYPNPKHRVAGDIDWYISDTTHFQILFKELIKRGIKVSRSTTHNIDFRWRSVDVDVNSKLFDVFSPLASRKLKRIKNKELSESVFIGKQERLKSFEVLPPNLNVVQVSLHILKHLLLFGVGLRQFCDLAILYNTYHKELNSIWLEKTYKDLKVINWIYVVHHFLVYYVGLSEQKLPFQLKNGVCSCWLMEEIMTTGNFGYYDQSFIKTSSSQILIRKNKTKRLWRSFKQYFPLAPFEAVCYPFVHSIGKLKLKTFD